MRRGAAQQGLHKKQHGYQSEEFEGCQLARGEVARQHLRMHVFSGALPSKVIEPAEHEEHPGGAAEKQNQAQCTP